MAVNISKYSIISTLALIESKLPFINHSFYKVSENFQSSDLISLHKEASNIFNYLGLYDYTVLVSFVKMDQSAGDIELNNNSDKTVYININETYKYNNAAVLCILAHEICHKLLYVNNLYIPNMRLENEVRTDLATIITGLGKLTLNGCINTRVSKKHISKDMIGYLSDKQFAEAYYYVYSSRGISTTQMLDGVNYKISEYIENLIKEHSYSDGNQYTTSYLIKQIQDKEASLLYYLKYLSYICEHINHFVRQSIKNKFTFISSKELNIYNNERPISLLYTHTCIKEHFNNEANFQYLIDKIEQFMHDIYNRTESIESYTNPTTCPLCGYNNNNLAEKDSVYRCPKCHHLFYNKTSLFKYNCESENINEKEIQLLKDKISKLETELLILNQKVKKFEKGSLKYRFKALLKCKLPL